MQAATLWVILWAYYNVAGWGLSAAHLLNAAGYAVVSAPLAVFIFLFLKKHPPTFRAGRFFCRFRRPLPAIFLFLSILIFLGGALYAPANYDALTYRLPRMLNWLAEGRWHWISAANDRMNYSGPAWEWTGMPLLALTHSDRALFIIDFSGYLLMPGLFFCILRRLEVSRHVAWTWMWVLPLAYGYATQAGSIGNDLTGTVFCLLSVSFGLKARTSGKVTDVWLALLAAALMTGTKVSNAPLALPCLVAVWPALGQLRNRLAGTAAVAGVGLLISAAPIMLANQMYSGNWTGDPGNKSGMQLKNPVAALLGNLVLVVEQTFAPPILPPARKVTDAINGNLPASWSRLLERDYPRFKMAALGEMPTEEGAGLGLGVALLLLAGLVAACWHGGKRGGGGKFSSTMVALMLAAWAAGMVYMLKLGSEAAARLMLSYYPIMIAPLLAFPGQDALLRWRGGRVLASLCALSLLPALILSPSRPLWPAQSICEKLVRQHPGKVLYQRMSSVYSGYANRNDVLAPVRAGLPDSAHEVGFIAGSNDTDYSLWRPFFRRRIVYPTYDLVHFKAHPNEFEWLVVKDDKWPTVSSTPLDEWARVNHYQVVFSTNLVELVAWGGEQWSVLHRIN